MKATSILRAWIWLVGLSLGSTAITLWVWPESLTWLAGCVILCLAWAKARVILSRYLGLCNAPFWQRGFDIALGLFCLVLLGLFLVPTLL
ncbi:nitric oxide reductase F protein [Roseovarius sp. 2305UL8-3]|uniref:nitric oxide reductase F protein n=1 Tax=Roseovarius conchicola TaxID=3121636 RepID=UPI00352879F2